MDHLASDVGKCFLVEQLVVQPIECVANPVLNIVTPQFQHGLRRRWNRLPGQFFTKQKANSLTEGRMFNRIKVFVTVIDAMLFQLRVEVVLHTAHQVGANAGDSCFLNPVKHFLRDAGRWPVAPVVAIVVEARAQGKPVSGSPQVRQLRFRKAFFRQRNTGAVPLHVRLAPAEGNFQFLVAGYGAHGRGYRLLE